MPIQQSEEIIAGGDDDYLEARHVMLKGTKRERWRERSGTHSTSWILAPLRSRSTWARTKTARTADLSIESSS